MGSPLEPAEAVIAEALGEFSSGSGAQPRYASGEPAIRHPSLHLSRTGRWLECKPLDLERKGYTVITYCASKLPRSLLQATEVIIVTGR